MKSIIFSGPPGYRVFKFCISLIIGLAIGTAIFLVIYDAIPKQRNFPTSPGLRELAEQRGILIGTAVQPRLLEDEPIYAQTLAEQFNSITHESHLKWGATEAQYKTYTWGEADAVAAFAIANKQTIRGHTLVWPNEFQYQATPDYVRNAPDAAAMQLYIDDHIAAVVNRYADVVDRWDVINEPLETLGSAVDQNPITAMLGEAWMVRAFQQVRDLDPTAKLYLNEALADRPGPKHAGLMTLAKRLMSAGAPIDGIGLQGHFLLVGTPTVEELLAVMHDWEELGLEVAITELDIPIGIGGETAQARNYANVISACLQAAACKEVTFWGFTDKHTWLNDFISPRLTPLLFDADYLPKPSYAAIFSALKGDAD